MGSEMPKSRRQLNLRSDFRGRQKDYLTYSVLGGLMRQGRVAWNKETKRFTAHQL